jgi:hypothetical protein
VTGRGYAVGRGGLVVGGVSNAGERERGTGEGAPNRVEECVNGGGLGAVARVIAFDV